MSATGPAKCPDCGGTGIDAAKTGAARRTGRVDSRGAIRCWTCHGGGLDPAELFRWGPHPPLPGQTVE